MNVKAQGRPPILNNELTRQEVRCSELVAKAYSNGVIARHLGISRRTVQNYLSSVYSKLELPPRKQRHQRVMLTLWMQERQK